MRIFFLLSCLLAWVLAAPVADTEAAFRILGNYLQRFDGDDLSDYYIIREPTASKRGVGPRPLRFG